MYKNNKAAPAVSLDGNNGNRKKAISSVMRMALFHHSGLRGLPLQDLLLPRQHFRNVKRMIFNTAIGRQHIRIDQALKRCRLAVTDAI